MALRRLDFEIGGTIAGSHDAALLLDGEDPVEALRDQIISSIGLDVEVTIGGVKAPWTFWMDPDHWAEDWRGQEGPDFDPYAHILDAIGDYERKAGG